MSLFVWSNQYSVGIPGIDEQHRRLFSLINDLHDAMLAGQGTEQLSAVLQELVNYTRVHFADEEEMMRRHRYPAYAAHKAVHDAFAKRAEALLLKQRGGKSHMTLEVMTALKDWLVLHIKGSDQLYTTVIPAVA